MLRPAQDKDFQQLWRIIRPIVQSGDTYVIDPGISSDDIRQYWLVQPLETWLWEVEGRVLGTYYLRPNQPGPGSHICNCGYMVASEARGQGIASAMCTHSLQRASALGYHAMQFNFVVSTNQSAVRLWRRFDFHIAGTLPDAFRHPTQGLVDAYIMYRRLREPQDKGESDEL